VQAHVECLVGRRFERRQARRTDVVVTDLLPYPVTYGKWSLARWSADHELAAFLKAENGTFLKAREIILQRTMNENKFKITKN